MAKGSGGGGGEKNAGGVGGRSAEPADAPKAGSDENAILEVSQALRPNDAFDHVLLSARDTRKELGWSKERFDSTILKMERDGKVTLHHHDHPKGLKPEDREKLIADKHGNHYTGFVFEDGVKPPRR